MGTAKRHKIANKYREELDDLVFGDDAADKAAKGLDVLSMLTKGGGEIASKVAADKKAAADAKAQQDRINAARDARDKAADAAAAAEIAERQAAGEKNANGTEDMSGPLHIAALKARQDANKADAKARNLEAQAGMGMMPTSGYPGGMPGAKSLSHPWYFYGGIAAGVVLGGAVLYRVFSGGSSSRYVRSAR